MGDYTVRYPQKAKEKDRKNEKNVFRDLFVDRYFEDHILEQGVGNETAGVRVE
jgi:hypothetical protein